MRHDVIVFIFGVCECASKGATHVHQGIYPKLNHAANLGLCQKMRIVVPPMSKQMKRELSELVDPKTQLKGEVKVIKKRLKDAEKAADREMEAFLRRCNAEHTAFKADLRTEIRRRETAQSKKKLKAALKGVVDKGTMKRKRELHYENLWYAALQHR